MTDTEIVRSDDPRIPQLEMAGYLMVAEPWGARLRLKTAGASSRTDTLGAAISGRTLHSLKVGWSGRSTILFAMVGVVLLAAAVPTLLIANPTEPLKFTVTGCLGLAMGMQAGSARHIGVKDVTTVVGALLLRIHIGAGMATAAAITLVVAALGHLGRPGRRTENYGRPAHSTS